MNGRICVFCGAAEGNRGLYGEMAVRTGGLIAGQGLGLVYGGGKVGLMGKVADAALEHHGEVIGVIPEDMLERELAHTGATSMHVVKTMLERKQRMADLSNAFLTLPGGTGTLDELFEMLTWSQLGYQKKPCGLLNVEGYYDPLIAMLDNAMAEGFLKPQYRSLLIVAEDPEHLIDLLVTAMPKE